MTRPDDQTFMRRALELAQRGLGRVEPNPVVGCVIARDGKIIAEGWHQRYGGPHAEIEALNDAQARGITDFSGCDVYVTLEPCCHHGKTPPCTDALIRIKPRRVIVAMIDPFPAVAGKGISILKHAGIQTDVGIGETEAREIQAPFIKRVTRGLPWVTGKWAQTLDGYIATSTGDSKWISGTWSRDLVHELRGRVDAIMVGVGTAVADDPFLTARPTNPNHVYRSARRVIIDPTLRLPLASRLLHDGGPPVTLVVDAVATRELVGHPVIEWLQKIGGEVIKLKHSDGPGSRMSLLPLMEHLASAHSSTNVLVEGGSTLMSHLIEEGLVDELMVFVAPKLLGDPSAVPAIRGAARTMMAEARQLKLRSMNQVEEDVVLRYRV